MCLIVLAWNMRPDYPLVVAANRDEFHARATQGAAFWDDAPSVFAGRDLEAGGTWCGVDRGGRFGAVTNVREPATPDTGRLSRGALVADYLRVDDSAYEYCRRLWPRRADYGAFNLLVADAEDLCYLGNRDTRGVLRLPAGVIALSNGVLGDEWRKTRRARAGFTPLLASAAIDTGRLLALLAEDTPAHPQTLPDTGVGHALELQLSPVFIRGERYGTRASTVILRAADGRLRMVERSFGARGVLTAEIDRWVG